jgi:hypothetical protein
MSINQLQPFLDALHRHDLEAVAAAMADDVVLKSPIVVEPFRGKERVLFVLGHLLKVVDEFNAIEILEGPEHFAVFLEIRADSIRVEGMDFIRLNATGLVQSMTITWRPLPAVVAVQNRLAVALGVTPLRLVEANVADQHA